MSRVRDAALGFDAITIEGGLLPADWLARVAQLAAPQQSAIDYDVPKGLNLRDELGRYWRIAAAHWQDFATARASAADARAPTQRLVAGLMRDVCGATDFEFAIEPAVVNGFSYPVRGFACGGKLPVVVGFPNVSLDQRDRAFGDGGRQRSAFGLLQDYLNAEDAALWGIACNGVTLRLARDNASLTRPAWIEADIERIFTEDRFADFTLLWLLIHASRFGSAGQPPQQCALEAWREASREEGTRARDQLRDGVAQALLEIGNGFLSHPANSALRDKIVHGELGAQHYFRELLRLVYRLIFLLTIEERGLLHPQGADENAVKLYAEAYGLKRLAQRARRRRAYDRHADLWQGLKPVWTGLATGQSLLALPALGGLFAYDQCADLDSAELPNRALLSALAALCWLRIDNSLVRTNWRDMRYEEFGSIYESLLELVPDITDEAHAFRFAGDDESRGNERKTTGSYYTPDELVQQLLDSALEPVIEQRLAGAADPEAALLSITVCDPACGSGHFLLAAAFRLADRLARLRAGGTPGGDEYRHALRDVIAHCVYGVDMNPMALELARTALWLEAMTPDRPLGFLDHHLQCGDALLGVLDLDVLNHGLPDDAFKTLTGDDKDTTSELKKRNKSERTSWQRALSIGDLFRAEHLADDTDAVEKLADDDLAQVAAKRELWRRAETAAQGSRLARLADLYVGAFLLPKTPTDADAVPTSKHLWAIAHNQHDDTLAEAEAAARTACDQARVFHWWLAFPHIHAAGGFAVMLGNPPWERIKLQEQEFFAARSADIAEAKNKAQRGQRIQWLSEGMLAAHLDGSSTPSEAQVRAERQLFDEFAAARRTAEAASAFAHVNDGRYPLTGHGDVDTYALFAETFSQARHPQGRAGLIVKSGIATDDTYKRFFQAIATSSQMASLFGFDNAKRIFPAVHPDTPFVLLTVGTTLGAADLCHYILAMSELDDSRRHFTLTADDFALLNPNTRTCPVFRSQRDAELTKAIYRRVPVLIREAVKDTEGNIVEPEVNPWGVSIRQGLFHLTNDIRDGIVHDGRPRGDAEADLVPVIEGKMTAIYDHHWASYVADGDGGLDTADCTDVQKADPDFAVTPRYWVERCEVLTRIARVPRPVANAWLACHKAEPSQCDAAAIDLNAALAQWTAGALFRREAGDAALIASAALAQAAARATQQLVTEFPPFAAALNVRALKPKKQIELLTKCAALDAATPLADTELAALRQLAARADAVERAAALAAELDGWMDTRSPRWLMGWRDITNATNERTVIAAVMPRLGVAYTERVVTSLHVSPERAAAFLANLNSLVFDFTARQAVAGTHLSDYITKQLPVLQPDRYTATDLDFIVPRVLELTYTANDLTDWARDLGYDGPPFAWNPDRRAQLRAELDAYYARLYGLTRDELRYILDPAAVEGGDYPSETFRVLKNNETRAFGEYRTQRLMLEAWDASEATLLAYSPTQGVVRSDAEARYASLILALIRRATVSLSRQQLDEALYWVGSPEVANQLLSDEEKARLAVLRSQLSDMVQVQMGSRLDELLRTLERASCIRVQSGNFLNGAGHQPAWIPDVPEVGKLADLLSAALKVRTTEMEPGITQPDSTRKKLAQ